VAVTVRNRPLKIKTVDPSGEFVRERLPLSTGIAVKLPSMDFARPSDRSTSKAGANLQLKWRT
jgi:hypothetical protein